MLPLRAWPAAARRAIAGVLTDIDDTLTTEGAITPDALQALHALAARGLPTIAITGRPVGWSEPFALAWPVAGIVAENGAVTLTRGPDGTLRKLYLQDEDLRRANHARMQQVAGRILREVPGATLSRDSGGRETDIAIDHSEFAHLPPEAIAQVAAIMRSEGMNATVSSIHVNGWYGAHHKLSGARWALRELLARELDAERERWVYVGDSTNDVLMFEHFPHSVGVANIRRFEPELAFKPAYVTAGERGAGFAEVAQALLAP
ncbi:HAD-IIB family hydrolase [Ramlibacter alkalitolerans]|uniref:HAD family phosphatase n=1 Tax=Ramlibacter alkalitolerans TaxID=2039631 RepID=A0ABS1JQC1_9BURK|nr:HAD-IIB family hydrolase [Ramlibacter alkalitolerans]MBL0426442.1 HAD family phosphatase [Ramlibacter alkalitolerans]